MKQILFLLFLAPLCVHALVDMKNANYSDSWTDLVVPGDGYDLKVERTYNSRTLFNGIFGFGWCSDLESRLEKTPEGSLKLTECGGGLEVTYTQSNFKYSQIETLIDKIISGVKKKNTSLKNPYLVELRKKLHYDINLRSEFVKRLKIKSSPNQLKGIFYAEGRINESIQLKSGFYLRKLPNGSYEKYNKRGELAYMYDKNNKFIKVSRNKKRQIIRVTDNNGRKLTFKYHAGIGKVKSIIGPGNLKTNYKFSGEDLVYAKNSWKKVYLYKVDSLHNLVEIIFPDKTTKKISYNKDKDWVLSFTNRKKCVEKYSYKGDKKNPLNHYWSNVVKTCKNKVVNNSSYEFFHRKRTDGSRYLYRTRTKNNERITDVVYHQVFGKPISVYRNGFSIRLSYYDNGLVRQKREPARTMDFSYKNSCLKVSKVISSYFDIRESRKTASQKKKLLKVVTTNFSYSSKKCNLVSARNSLGQLAFLSYDHRGRISRIKDQAKRIVELKYEERFGKPTLIRRPGLGTIRVTYKPDGSIKDVKSKEGPQVAIQVANVFNTLLEILSPATGELTI